MIQATKKNLDLKSALIQFWDKSCDFWVSKTKLLKLLGRKLSYGKLSSKKQQKTRRRNY
jgi:hypothetical protein